MKITPEWLDKWRIWPRMILTLYGIAFYNTTTWFMALPDPSNAPLHAPESGLFEPPMVLPLDTGCVWGGCLTAAEFRSDSAQVTLIKQPCPQAQQPS